jgi:hypothetical protein
VALAGLSIEVAGHECPSKSQNGGCIFDHMKTLNILLKLPATNVF